MDWFFRINIIFLIHFQFDYSKFLVVEILQILSIFLIVQEFFRRSNWQFHSYNMNFLSKMVRKFWKNSDANIFKKSTNSFNVKKICLFTYRTICDFQFLNNFFALFRKTKVVKILHTVNFFLNFIPSGSITKFLTSQTFG